MPVDIGATPTELNFTDDTPAIPAGRAGVKWQAGTAYPDPNVPGAQVRDFSAYVDDGGVNEQTGTSYTLLESDNRKLVYFDNVSSPPESIAVAISPSADLGSTFFCWLENLSEGTVTLTPDGSETIDGAASLTLDQNQGVMLFSDGSNLFTSRGRGSGGGGSFTAGGDLSGTSSSQTVIGLRGKSLDSATVGSPSDGDVITYDSASGKYKAAAPSGGSGSSLVGVITPATLVPPPLGDFTWFNQGSITATNNSANALLLVLATGTGVFKIGSLYKSLPGSWSTSVIGFTGSRTPGLLRESSTGKSIIFGIDNNGARFHVAYYNGDGTFNSNPVTTTIPTIGSLIRWAFVRVSGSNLIFGYSYDGQILTDVATLGATAFLSSGGANQYGIAEDQHDAFTDLIVHVNAA